MKVVSFSFDLASKKWSVPALPSGLDSERTFVLAFGPPAMADDAAALGELVRAFPRSHVLGCSSTGGVDGVAVRDGALLVTVLQFEKTTMSSTQTQTTATSDAFSAGQALAKKLSKPSLRALVVLGDGVALNGTELVRGLNSALDRSVVVVGGLAADGGAFARSWVLSGSHVKSAMVAAVGLYGEHVVLAPATRSGWAPLGAELVVSRSDGPIVYELDGKPALAVFEERLATAKDGAKASVLSLPFAVRATARHDKSLVRSVVAVDAQKKALRLAAEIPQGYLVQPLTASAESLVASARDAAEGTRDASSPVGTDALVLVISHAGRRGLLGERASEEVAAAIAGLPAGPAPHVAGFFGYGEIAPVTTGHSDLHNQSVTVAMLMESPTPIVRKAVRGLVASAARAQAPSSNAGPAAHLRSRHQTVDDLFLELEVEGGKGGVRAPGKLGPPPPVPKRPPLPAPPSVPSRSAAPASPAMSGPIADNVPSAVDDSDTADDDSWTSPSMRVAAAALTAPPPPTLSHSVTPPPVAAARAASAPPPPDRARSRMKTPRMVDVDAAALTAKAKPELTLTTFAHDAEAGAWSTGSLPAVDSPRTLVLVFGVPTLGGTTGPLEELAKAYPSSCILGCASSRLLRGAAAGSSDLLVSTARFAHTELESAWADAALGATAAGASIAHALSRPDLRAVMIFADATTDGEALARALSSALPPGVVITGGVAASAGGRGWVMSGKTIRSGIVAAVGFYGAHVAVHSESRFDFDAFGPERTVTRSSGPVVYEIDGKPALSVYAEYVGGAAASLQSLPFPLSVRQGNEVVGARLPVSFDSTAQSITFAGDVPRGALVRLMRANPDRLVDEVARAAAAGRDAVVAGSSALVLAVSSIGRAQAMGGRAEEELEAILESFPADGHAQIAGFYSLAELGTGSGGLGNGTIALTLFSEADAPLARHDPPSERRTIPVPANPASPAFAPHPTETPSPPQALRSSQTARRRTEVTRAVASGGAAPTGAAVAAKVTKEKKGDIVLVSFHGRLSESFKGGAVGRELSGTVVFDLGGVERITSFGVREWLDMLSAAQDRVKRIYFAHCSEAVVNQLSMIRKFAGGAQVVSFFAPYLCDSCGEQFERLFDSELDVDAIRGNAPPESVCQRCSGKGRFDDDPETYFAFAPAHLGEPVPANVRALLNELDAMQPAATADAIDKSVDGEITRVRVSTKLASNVRWQRVLDGIEGSLVIDLGGVGAVDENGITNFENALTSLSSDVVSARIERAPQLVVEHFARSGLPRRVVVASTIVSGHCPSCNVQRPALLVVDDHAHNLGAGKDPVLSCKRCNGRLDLVDASELLTFLARQRKRTSFAPRASVPPPAATGAALSIPAMPLAAPLPTDVSAPPAMATSSGRGVIAGAAILSVAILASAGFFAYARTRSAQAADVPARPAPTQPTTSLTDLPPPWVERPFVEENGFLLVVGRCDRAANAEAALAQARNEAVARIVKQAYGDLAGTPLYDFLVSRVNEDDAKTRTATVAERYLRQVGSIGTPDRGETVVRQRDGGVEAFARYRLSRGAYMQMLALYKATGQFQGMTVARAFPLLDVGRSEADLVVIGVGRGRPAEAAGAKVGDLVLGMNAKPVPNVDAFVKAGDDWNGVPNGGAYDVTVESAGAKETLKVKKAYAAVYAPPPVAPPRAQPPQPPQPPPPPSQRGKDMGIIAPSRTF